VARYLLTEAVNDIPGVGIDQVVQHVHALSEGIRAVTAAKICRSMHLSEQTVAAMLDKAERLGMVRRDGSRGWLPVVGRTPDGG
jgi:DNA-binding IclR family transcriptional regulator